MLWNASIVGPDETPWEGGVYQVKMTFTEKEIRESLKQLQKQRKTVEILDSDSEEEEEDVNASEEERAFLMAIDQEKKLQKTTEMETHSSTENNN